MNIEQFYEYCLSKKGVTEHFPFDENTLVFKVGQKMFALSALDEWESNTPKVNLKCDPENAELLRAEFNGIRPGYHMNKTHWNTVAINEDVTDKMVFELIDHSYDLVFNSLSKKIQSLI